MSNRNLVRVLALVLVLCTGIMMMSACQKQTPVEETPAATEAPGAEEPVETPAEEEKDVPLVVGYAPFSEKFSPFYADTAYDQDVVSMTMVSPLTTDRQGGIIYNAIEGETVNYNGTDYFYDGIADISVDQNADGTTTYTMKLRDDVKFSDGEPLTADDIIFTYYVLCDPAYVGSTTLSSYGILGVKDYMTQTTSEVYDKYAAEFDAIMAGETVDAAKNEWVAAKIDELWKADVQATTDYCMANYLGAYAEMIGKTAEEISADANLQNAFTMAMWGFGSVGEDGVLTGGTTGTTWDLANGAAPTFDELFAEVSAKYEGSAAAYIAAGESAVGADVVADAKSA